MRMTRYSARLRRGALGVAAVLLASACGSTAQWDKQIAADGSSLEGSVPGGQGEFTAPGVAGADQAASEDGSPGNGPQAAAGSTGSASGTATPGSKATQQRRQPSTSTPPPGASGRGFTKTEIFVGVATQKDTETAGNTLGVAADFGDQEAIVRAILNDINSRGGVAGRKLVPVFYDIDSAQAAQDPNAVAQEACARWTEDRQVFAAVSLASSINNDTLYSCLAKRQTPLVVNDVSLHSAEHMRRYAGYLYAPSVPSLERLVPTWLRRAATQGYFKERWDTMAGGPGATDVKVGLLHTTDPSFYGDDRFGALVKRELANQSVSVAAEFQHSGNTTSISGEMSQAVLRFQQAGVTHVISDGALLFFMQAAESQNYRPRYTVTSFHAPGFLQDTAPARQSGGAIGVGYVPTIDVDNKRDPGDVSKAQTHCRKVMKQAGQNVSNRQAMLAMLLNCDGFTFLASAIEKGSLSPAGMQQGAGSLRAMPPAATFAISFSGSRQDGATKARDLAYRNDCGCFAYPSRTNHGM